MPINAIIIVRTALTNTVLYEATTVVYEATTVLYDAHECYMMPTLGYYSTAVG